MENLLNCPFCGSSNIHKPVFAEYIADTYAPRWWTECNDCPCSMEIDGEDLQILISAWNTRSITQ